jgi:hypothetical protein
VIVGACDTRSVPWSNHATTPLLGTYSTSALVYGDYYYTLLDLGFLFVS